MNWIPRCHPLLAAWLGSVVRMVGLQAQDVAHPLEPLSAAEIVAAQSAIKQDARYSPSSRFALITLREPSKADVLGWHPGTPVERRATAILFDWKAGVTHEIEVDVRGGRVRSWRDLPRAQPWMMEGDQTVADSLIRLDPRWQAALRRRAIDPTTVELFAAPADGFVPLRQDGGRMSMVMTAWKSPRSGELPIFVLADLARRRILSVVERQGPSQSMAATGPDSLKGLRPSLTPPKPLVPTMPEGSSFTVSNHEVRWQQWRFRFGVESRSGLILYQIGWEDHGMVRPILYRAAVAEMAVPYGDPGWHLWMPLDLGLVGLGNYSKTSFQLGREVPENAQLFESVMHDANGNPLVVPRSVALYERDGGTLWRHGAEARRARELVLAFYATVDNYDYGFFWVFHQDGTLELELQLTGQMNARPVSSAGDTATAHHERPAYGTRVSRDAFAPNHQHFFSFRLDFDVDGPAHNRVVEMNVTGDAAAAGRPNGFPMRETVLRHERDAQRNLNLATHRMWKVVSDTRNALGQFTAYGLMPGENATPMVPADAFIRRRVGFVNSHVWVTPYADGEIYAAGDFVFNAPGGQGLPQWTKANREIADRDIVLWYTLGVTHIPRPEDWPWMPVHRTGFKLVPLGFFGENPTLGLPGAAGASPPGSN